MLEYKDCATGKRLDEEFNCHLDLSLPVLSPRGDRGWFQEIDFEHSIPDPDAHPLTLRGGIFASGVIAS
jgi:hypothetical protein